jgi:hypothetical protein
MTQLPSNLAIKNGLCQDSRKPVVMEIDDIASTIRRPGE